MHENEDTGGPNIDERTMKRRKEDHCRHHQRHVTPQQSYQKEGVQRPPHQDGVLARQQFHHTASPGTGRRATMKFTRALTKKDSFTKSNRSTILKKSWDEEVSGESDICWQRDTGPSHIKTRETSTRPVPSRKRKGKFSVMKSRTR